MMVGRKFEEFEDDRGKWKIYFDLDDNRAINEKSILVRFNRKGDSYSFSEIEIEKLKQDLKDLGKLRIINQGREFLEN